jgi:ureidoglycolate dehydrogenase (NAD+)
MGLINSHPQVVVRRTGRSTAIVDGDNGPGQVVGARAMDEAITLASESGIGACSARASNHFGTAGWIAARAAERSMIGIAASHAEADVIPFGGRVPWLGTNPVAVAVPGPTAAMVLDMATSNVAMGKVLLAAREGRPIPDDWAVDDDGRPTTDATAARAVRPLGGPKGYGLAVMVDVLCALLSGTAFGPHIKRMYDDFDVPQDISHLVVAMDVSRFVEPSVFKERLEAFGGELKSVPPADGFPEVLLPGEPEESRRAEARRAGADVPTQTIEDLRSLAAELGVAIDRALTGSPHPDER